MTQRTIDLLIRIAIEIVEFIDTILKKKRGSKGLSAESGYKLQRVGGNVLGMLN